MPGPVQETLNRLRRMGEVTVTAPGFAWWTLIAHVQLACRHPGHLGPSRDYAIEICRAIQDQMETVDAEVARLIEQGWHPVYDVPSQQRPRTKETSDGHRNQRPPPADEVD